MSVKLETRNEEKCLVVAIGEERLDARLAVSFKEKMIEFVTAGHLHIVLNLSKVSFVDSSGLGAIVSILKAIGRNGDLMICHIQTPVMGLFKLTRMDRVFRIFETEALAIEAISK